MCGDAPKRIRHPIDECALKPDICGSGDCVDLPDGYMCQCLPGYTNNGTSGKDYCEGRAAALAGFFLIDVLHLRLLSVSDVNECMEPGMCKPNGKCVNTPGSFYCECLTGFEASGDGKSCVGESNFFNVKGHCRWHTSAIAIQFDISLSRPRWMQREGGMREWGLWEFGRVVQMPL